MSNAVLFVCFMPYWILIVNAAELPRYESAADVINEIKLSYAVRDRYALPTKLLLFYLFPKIIGKFDEIVEVVEEDSRGVL